MRTIVPLLYRLCAAGRLGIGISLPAMSGLLSLGISWRHPAAAGAAGNSWLQLLLRGSSVGFAGDVYPPLVPL